MSRPSANPHPNPLPEYREREKAEYRARECGFLDTLSGSQVPQVVVAHPFRSGRFAAPPVS
jgi:hypothetical protein